MKPPPFDLLRAESADEAVDALRTRGDDTKILAGGQSLMTGLRRIRTGFTAAVTKRARVAK